MYIYIYIYIERERERERERQIHRVVSRANYFQKTGGCPKSEAHK